MGTNETNQMASIIMCITCGCQYGVYWGNSCRKNVLGICLSIVFAMIFMGTGFTLKRKLNVQS